MNRIFPQRPRAFLFDMDGTLADTLPLCIESFRKTIEKLSGNIIDR